MKKLVTCRRLKVGICEVLSSHSKRTDLKIKYPKVTTLCFLEKKICDFDLAGACVLYDLACVLYDLACVLYDLACVLYYFYLIFIFIISLFLFILFFQVLAMKITKQCRLTQFHSVMRSYDRSGIHRPKLAAFQTWPNSIIFSGQHGIPDVSSWHLSLYKAGRWQFRCQAV